jgi:hypothetical protein
LKKKDSLVRRVFRMSFFMIWILWTMLVVSDIALGGSFDLPAILSSWPELGKLLAFGAIVQFSLRAIAEVLTRSSDALDNASPAKESLKKAASGLSEVAWFLGVVLGKFGYGEPKLVTAEKISQLSISPPEEKVS